MKHIRLILFLSIGIQASAFAVFAQNAIVSFDLTQLQTNVLSDTVTASDGTTELTVSARSSNGSARSIALYTALGLRAFYGHQNKVIFNFNTAVRIESYRIGSADTTFTGDELLTLSLSGTNYNETFPVDNSDLAGQTRTFNNKLIFPAGTNLELITHNPDFGQQSVRWNILTVTTVPEPETYALILAGFALTYTALRRRVS